FGGFERANAAIARIVRTLPPLAAKCVDDLLKHQLGGVAGSPLERRGLAHPRALDLRERLLHDERARDATSHERLLRGLRVALREEPRARVVLSLASLLLGHREPERIA